MKKVPGVKVCGPYPMYVSPFVQRTWEAIGSPRRFTVRVEQVPGQLATAECFYVIVPRGYGTRKVVRRRGHD